MSNSINKWMALKMRKAIILLMVVLMIATYGPIDVQGADVPDSWAKAEVDAAIAAGIVPKALQSQYTVTINREEFCGLLMQIIATKWQKDLNGIIKDKGLDMSVNPFTDTTNQSVLVANKLGIVNGKGGGLFSPKGLITRQEAAVMLTNAAALLGEKTQGSDVVFLDSKDQASWAKAAINYVYLTGIMGGTAEYTFSFKTNYTRQQAILTALRLHKQLNPKTRVAMKTLIIPEDKAVIRVWIEEGANRSYMESAAKAFNTLYPNVTFEFTQVAYQSAHTLLKTTGPKGTGPDVFTESHNFLTYLVTNKLVKVNDNITTNKFFGSTIYGSKDQEGVLYGYPMSCETHVLYYNKGLIKSVPKTYDEVIALAKTYNKPETGQYALVWDVKSGYANYPFLSGYSPKFFVDNIKEIGVFFEDTTGFEAGLTAFQSLRTSLYPVASKDSTYATMVKAFTDKKAAMMIDGPWAKSAIEASKIDYGVAQIPTLQNGKKPNTLADIRLLFVSSYSKYPKAAKLFAAFLTGKEMQTLQSSMTDLIPVRGDVSVTKPIHQAVIKQMATSTAKWTDDYGLLYGGVVEPTFGAVWDGKKPATAVKEVISQLKMILGI